MAALVPRRAGKAGGDEQPVGAKPLAQAYQRGLQPTPSPLRRMEDPCADHIMPSRNNNKSKKEKHALMLPPAFPLSRTRRMTQPQVLDEDTFVDAMGEIIERDFFPELPRLHRQMKWLEALEARRLRSLTGVRRVVQSEMRRDSFGAGASEGGASSSLSSLAFTPVGGGGGGQRQHMAGSDTPLSISNSSDSPSLPLLPLSLDQFLARFQSEDDAAFDVLAERMRDAHRRKYWWIYQHPHLEAGKEKLYLLPNGEMMMEEQHKKHVAAANAKPRLGDDRPNGPETWPSRPQNNLMFLPGSLEENAKVHQKGVNGATQLLLEGGGGGREGTMMLTAGARNTRVGQTAKAPKSLVHSNTRFSPTNILEWKAGGGGGRASPLERLSSGMSTLSSDSSCSTDTQEARARAAAATQGFVPMTPLLIPGMGGDVPIVTWGEIGSTPLRVSEPFDYLGGGGGGEGGRGGVGVSSPYGGGGGGREGGRKSFEIKSPTFREKVAEELEAKAKTRKGGREGGGGGGGKSSSSSSSSVYASSSGGGAGGGGRKSSYLSSSSSSSSSSSKKRGLGSLTPAAQSLAAKLAAGAAAGGGRGGGDAFGGGASSQLRATYSGGQGVMQGRGSSRRVAVSSMLTPTPSPLRALPKRTKKNGGKDDGEHHGGKGGEGGGGRGGGGGGGEGGGGGSKGTAPPTAAAGGKSNGGSKVTENLLNF